MTPRDYATALYRTVRGKGKKEVDHAMKGLVEALRARGAVRLLPQILDEIPKAIAEAEAPNRVTVETAREMDEKAIEKIVRAAGADPETADVQQIVRPELIGGARIKKHGVTIDASVRGRLERIKQALSRAKA